MSASEHLDIRVEDGIMRIGLNRPEKKNALTAAMYHGMREALLRAQKDDAVKVVLIHGAGELFTAGNDLHDFNKRDTSKPSAGGEFLWVLQAFDKPLVAAVSGLAIGIGVTMLLHCDLVYAQGNARFRMPFVNIGLCPEAGASLLVTQNAGYRMAAELMMLGDFFDAHKALDARLINEIVTSGTALEHALGKAKQLAGQPGQALRVTKQLMKAQQQAVVEHMKVEFRHFGELLQSPESIAARNSVLAGNRK